MTSLRSVETIHVLVAAVKSTNSVAEHLAEYERAIYPGHSARGCASRNQVPNRDDLTIIEIAAGSSTAAVFTQNAFRAAPVLVAERNNVEADARYILINSGNANAGTGAPGLAACEQSCEASQTPRKLIQFKSCRSLPVS